METQAKNHMQRTVLSSTTQYLAILAFLVLIVLSPSIHFIRYIEFHDCKRVLQLALLSIVLIHVATNIKSPNNLIPISKNIRFSFLTLLTFSIVSAALATSVRQAFIQVSLFAGLCYLAIFTATLYQQHKEKVVQYLIYALIASMVLYMLSFYVGYLTALANNRPLKWPHPFYGFTNIRLFQQYQLWGLGLLCLPLLSFNLKQKNKIWLYLGLTLWWTLLFYAGSRGVILGLATATIFTALIYKKSAWAFLRTLLINALMGLTTYYVLLKLVPAWLDKSPIKTAIVFKTTSSGRVDLWQAAVDMMQSSPLFGIGPMNYYWHTPHGTHPHNTALQLGAEYGIPATLTLLSITVYAFYKWFQRCHPNKMELHSKLQKNLTVILFFTVIANGVYALFDGTTLMPLSQTLMFTVIGVMVGQYITVGSSESQLPSYRIRFRPVFAIIVLATMTWSIMPELTRGLTSYQREVATDERAFSMAPNTINPRIWTQQRRVEPIEQKK